MLGGTLYRQFKESPRLYDVSQVFLLQPGKRIKVSAESSHGKTGIIIKYRTLYKPQEESCNHLG